MHKNFYTDSKHFVLHPLTEGVCAAIAEDMFADSNAGLIDIGGQIVLFDTFLTPQAAMDLRRISTELYGRPPQIVINSHYHNDHIWGNQAFVPDAQIITSALTRDLIATSGMEELEYYSSNSAQRLEVLRAQREDADDEQRKQQLSLWIDFYEAIVEALPHLKVSMPGITFIKYLEIHGVNRTAQLIAFEGGHTGSDVVLHLPQDGIIFMSDLLFVDFHPYLADGDPLQLLNALRELSRLDASCFVPGHGPVGTNEDLKMFIDYIGHCFDTARTLVETGDFSEDRISKLKMPEMYQHWKAPEFYRTNLSFLYKSLSSADGSKQAA